MKSNFILNQESEQQKKIIDLAPNYNIIVDAVAGSGKTTTVLQLANRYRHKNILVVTYNKRLRLETKEKIHELKLNNIGSTNYHSLCSVLYIHSPNDSGIKKVVENDYTSRFNFGYDILIFDEFQDMTPLYFKIAYKLFKDNRKKNPTIIVIGDRFQCIYQYRDSSHLFLKHADKIMNWNDKPWVRCSLNISYRLTKPIANWMNYLIGEKRFKSQKISNIKPIYIYEDIKNVADTICSEINNLIKKGYSYTDMFILSPKVRFSNTKNILKNIILRLMYRGVPIYTISDADETFIEACSMNKLSFSTYHASKGLEKKVVIVFSFDSSYYNFYAKNMDKSKLSNPQYVALTRSLEQLIMVHISSNNFLTYVDPKVIPEYCDLRGYITDEKREDIPDTKIEINVTSLINHLPNDLLLELSNKIRVTSHDHNKPRLTVPHLIVSHLNTIDGKHICIEKETSEKLELHEYVAPITGNAIIMYFASSYGEKYLESFIRNIKRVFHSREKYHDQLLRFLSINYNVYSMDEFIKLPNSHKKVIGLALLHHVSNNLTFEKLQQINNFDWLDQGTLDECLYRLKETVGESVNVHFEKHISRDLNCYKIKGDIDFESDSAIWEFKCTSEIDKTHILQIAIYKWINKDESKSYRLYNPLLGQCYVIDASNDIIQDIILKILEYKYKSHDEVNEEEFIARNTLPKPERNWKDESNLQIKNFHFQGTPLQDITNRPLSKRKGWYVTLFII